MKSKKKTLIGFSYDNVLNKTKLFKLRIESPFLNKNGRPKKSIDIKIELEGSINPFNVSNAAIDYHIFETKGILIMLTYIDDKNNYIVHYINTQTMQVLDTSPTLQGYVSFLQKRELMLNVNNDG